MGGYIFGSSGPFFNGRTMLGGPIDAGNVYYVNNSPTSAKGIEMTNRYGRARYSDGSYALHQDDGTGAAIITAIAACKGGRNDYVILGNGTYTMTAGIDLAGKSSVHLLGQGGSIMDVGASSAVIIHQNGAYPALKMNAMCEVAGITFENCTGEEAIECPANLAYNSIHHCTFRWQMSAGINCINVLSNGMSWGTIFKNKIINWSGTSGGAAIYIGNAACWGVDVSYNDIICAGNNAVMDYGIFHTGLGATVKYNNITESGGTGSANGGTITVAISLGTDGCAIGNMCAVTATQGLAGGTASVSFVQNFDAASGGATAITT